MSVTHFYTQKIPYFGNHGAIVIGKGGSTAKALKVEFNLSMLRAFRDDDGLQYFIIKGIDERGVNHATIRVQGLIISSMARKEKSQIATLDCERWSHNLEKKLKRIQEHRTHIKLLGKELDPSNFPPLPKSKKKVSFAPMVMCRRKVLYPCETNI
jgi:hypothetical protein